MFRTRKFGWSDKVWRCTELGFGDTWAVTNFLLRVSEEIQAPTRVFSRNKAFVKLVTEIPQYLDTNGKIKFVTDVPQVGMTYCDPYRVRFYSTKKKWQPENIVAYQLEGRHLANFKNIPHNILNKLISLGYLPINVGGFKPLAFIIDMLSRCKFFVGCPSGIGVAALSVGCPVYIITSQLRNDYLRFMFRCQYYDKKVQVFKYTSSFLSALQSGRL